MNPHAAQPTSLSELVKSIWCNRRLILQMCTREVLGRYKGSIFGLLWSFLNPLLMLAVYTFVFSVVFKAKWGIGEDGPKSHFAIILFTGLIVHGLFAEVLSRAPGLILGNVNYVKKVVFPLEILPIISIGSALFHAGINLFVLFIVILIFTDGIHLTALLIPVVILPLIVLTLGLAWILASLGVYIRDIGQFIGIFTTILLFVSPIFFPISAVPEQFHDLIMVNPLTFIVEQSREVLIWGRFPNWLGLLIYTIPATTIAWLGFAWFQKTRKGFADVL